MVGFRGTDVAVLRRNAVTWRGGYEHVALPLRPVGASVGEESLHRNGGPCRHRALAEQIWLAAAGVGVALRHGADGAVTPLVV